MPDLDTYPCLLIREADGSLCWWPRWLYETNPPASSYAVVDKRASAN